MSSNRIVVPLDGSAESNAALPLARTLAKITGASITLMRVVPADDFQIGTLARSAMHRIAEELAGSGLTANKCVREGRPAEEIVNELRTNGASLVVMRTHGRAGVERLIIGSVTEQVVKESPVPVVLMRPGERRITSIQKLLVPVDGSPGGAVALGAAVGLARASNSIIKLLQVVVPVPLQTLVAYEYGGMGYYDPAWDEEAETAAQAYVDGLAKRLRDKGLTVETQVSVAETVPRGIIHVAERDDTDLVVMSTHALTGPARAVLGSTADEVVRHAPCPVLVVHRVESVASDSVETANEPTSVGAASSEAVSQ